MTATIAPDAGPAPDPPLAGLTRDPEKAHLYAADTFVQDVYDQLAGLTDDPVRFARAHGLLLLKPDAVVSRRLHRTLDWLGEQGFRVTASARTRLTPTTVRALWYFQWNIATAERRWLADLFFASTDSLLLVVTAETGDLPVSLALTEAKGPTAPADRRPGQLRHELGQFSFLVNLVHTTDEPADLLRELGVLLDRATRRRVLGDALLDRDRVDEARGHADALADETIARDLGFEGAWQRLRDAAAALARDGDGLPCAVREELAEPGDGEEGARRLLDVARRHELDLPPWDVAVVGSAVLPLKDPRGRQVIGQSRAAWWRGAHEHGR